MSIAVSNRDQPLAAVKYNPEGEDLDQPNEKAFVFLLTVRADDMVISSTEGGPWTLGGIRILYPNPHGKTTTVSTALDFVVSPLFSLLQP